MANSLVKLTLESNQYEQGLRQAQKMWKQFTDTIGLSAQKFTAAGIAIGTVTTAIKVAKDAFNSSQQNIDAWGRTVESAKGLYESFVSSLNNQDISGFLNNMDSIVTAAQNAYNAMSDLQMFNAFNQKKTAEARATYNEALDAYRLNPTFENKNALRKANDEVIRQLEEQKAQLERAYSTKLTEIAVNATSNNDTQQRFVAFFKDKSWEDMDREKQRYERGTYGHTFLDGNRVLGGKKIFDSSIDNFRDMTAQEQSDYEFARIISQVKEEQVKSVQALGKQAVDINSAIANQNRMYNRMTGNYNKKTTPTTTTTTHKEQTREMTEIEVNQKRINELTQEYVKLSDSASGLDMIRLNTIREEVSELEKRNNQLKLYMEQAQGKLLGGTVDVFNLQGSQFRGLAAADLGVPGLDPSLLPSTVQSRNVSNRFLHKRDDGGTEAFADEILGGLSSGFGQVVAGIENLGIEIPDSIKAVLNAVQGVTSILSGIATMVTAVVALQEAGLIKFWSTGGVVHAMGGYEVPGNFGFDAVPSMLTSGELVLNRAQQNTLASALKENGGGGRNGGGAELARISGEQIYVAVNRYLSRSGKGELVTWR